MMRFLILIFLVVPLHAFTLHFHGNPAVTNLTEISVDGALKEGQIVKIFAQKRDTKPLFVKEVRTLPARFMIASSFAQCYYIQVINSNGITEDYAPKCKESPSIINLHQLYLWLLLALFAGILFLFTHFIKNRIAQEEKVTIGFASFVQRLHLHALEQGKDIIFSTGGGISASFQNFAGFLTFREMNETARKAGSTLPLYTSDPVIHQMALEYVDKKQSLSSIIFSGGSDLTHMLLLKREVSRLKGESMVIMVGDLTSQTLLCVTPLKQEKNSVIVGTVNLDTLSSLLPSTTAIGIGSELFFLLSAFQKPLVLLLVRLFTILSIVIISLILLATTISLFMESSTLFTILHNLFGGAI
ncbi:hypothetical protein KAH37_06945 [bacterium]|nr:hypothetical protein [bacterium]